MNITSPILSPILAGASRVAEFPDQTGTSLLNLLWPGTGWFDDSLDGGLGMVMSGLAGVAAALLVAILLLIYFRNYRSTRDIVRHGLAAALLLGLIAFVISDVRHAALDYLGLNVSASGIEVGTDLPRTGLLGTPIGQPAHRPLPIGHRAI